MEAAAFYRKAKYVRRYNQRVRTVAMNAIYAQRLDGRFEIAGDELATKVMLETIYRVSTGNSSLVLNV